MSDIKVFKDIYEQNKIKSYSTYFKNFTKNERKKALIDSLSFDHYNTVETIFLTFPQLWKDFSKEDWVDLLKTSIVNIQNLNIDSRIVNSSNLSFLRLLYSYLNVNSFSILSDTGLSDSLLKKCYEYGDKYSSLFYKDENLIKEELEDFSNISFKKLKQISESLLTEGFDKIESSPADLSSKMSKLI